MKPRTAAGVATFVAALAAVTDCHSTPSPSDAKGSVSAPISDLALAALPDAAPPQMATFSLFSSDSGRRRRFAPGLALSRIDDGGSTPVALAPTTMSPDAQEMTAGPLAPGHYRAHFLVTPCAPDSPPDGCKPLGPKPDEIEFDVPASGSVEVTVR